MDAASDGQDRTCPERHQDQDRGRARGEFRLPGLYLRTGQGPQGWPLVSLRQAVEEEFEAGEGGGAEGAPAGKS